jgi:hypothetical protein
LGTQLLRKLSTKIVFEFISKSRSTEAGQMDLSSQLAILMEARLPIE